jgi:hypothetical protein
MTNGCKAGVDLIQKETGQVIRLTPHSAVVAVCFCVCRTLSFTSGSFFHFSLSLLEPKVTQPGVTFLSFPCVYLLQAAFGITLPLLKTASGEKQGKSNRSILRIDAVANRWRMGDGGGEEEEGGREGGR